MLIKATLTIILFCYFVCCVLFLISKFKARNRTPNTLIKNKPSSRIDYSDEEIVNLDDEVEVAQL